MDRPPSTIMELKVPNTKKQRKSKAKVKKAAGKKKRAVAKKVIKVETPAEQAQQEASLEEAAQQPESN